MANEHGNNPASKAMNQILVLGALVFFFTVLIFLFMLCIYAIMRRRVYLELPLARRNPGWLRRLSSIRENQSRVRNTGLDAKIIELLPMFVYTGSSTPGGTECSVCLSEFEDGEKLRRLPGCKHSFHSDCIDMWFHSHANCPLCRTKVEATVNNVLPEESGASSSNARDNLSIDMNIAVEQEQTSPSLPSMGIDSLSAEPDSFSSDMEMEETNSPSGSQSSRFSRLHSLKRMLSGRSRDGKVFPSNLHQNQNEIEGHS